MKRPANIEQPFFAYGLFRPGQLAFFQLSEFVSKVADPAIIAGSLLLRDGLPILDLAGDGSIRGALFEFRPDQAEDAYDRISAMEPDRHYRWNEIQVLGKSANVLVGRSPRKGSVPCDTDEWNGWEDPLFTAALEVVAETLNSQKFDWNLKPLFRLQMAYLLLWSSIERYVSLRYYLGDRVMGKILHLASEPAFAEGLLQYVKEPREVYRADQPDQREVLDPRSPEKSLNYYYQVRSNITHRGKGATLDHERVSSSLAELLQIFQMVLRTAESDARRLAQFYEFLG
jgi:hypothetical protein